MKIDVEEAKLEIYVAEAYVEMIRDSLTLIGACKVGNYDQVVSYQMTKGYWRPLVGSHPFVGEENKVNFGHEVKMEVHCPIHLVAKAIEIIKEIHPYEEPVINVIPLMNSFFK